ncbi:hypothetical protein SASPL_150672 [Salvia splendens]|uniref:DYW domain-containing protein n=1 Tax=Salvia splendens TaxID=180675 RepID=A0A8X8W6Z6_SALSN|nr:hypothetical protein SASPL_150672 [Salvia splendens]
MIDRKIRGDGARDHTEDLKIETAIQAITIVVGSPIPSLGFKASNLCSCEAMTESELNRLSSSPPPTFKFLKDADDKFMRKQEAERRCSSQEKEVDDVPFVKLSKAAAVQVLIPTFEFNCDLLVDFLTPLLASATNGCPSSSAAVHRSSGSHTRHFATKSLASPESARRLFDEMTERDMVSYTMLITGYSQSSEFDKALRLYVEMVEMGFKPNEFTFGSALKSAGGMQSLSWCFHPIRLKIRNEVSWNALIAAYAREGEGHCSLKLFAEMKRGGMARGGGGALRKKVFDRLVKKDVVSWNSMLTAYAQHGHGQEAIDLFEEMRDLGLEPNEISYLCVINACSHTGLVDVGELERAERFILKMPIEPTAAVWKALLGACRVHKNMFLGGYAAEHVFELDPYESGPHMLLSNLYASHERRDEAARVRKIMADSGVKKEPACSWVEIGSSKLREEITKMGYEADTSHVLWYADQREREERLQLHSEKLALAFALLNTPEGAQCRSRKILESVGIATTMAPARVGTIGRFEMVSSAALS